MRPHIHFPLNWIILTHFAAIFRCAFFQAHVSASTPLLSGILCVGILFLCCCCCVALHFARAFKSDRTLFAIGEHRKRDRSENYYYYHGGIIETRSASTLYTHLCFIITYQLIHSTEQSMQHTLCSCVRWHEEKTKAVPTYPLWPDIVSYLSPIDFHTHT